MPEWRLMVFDLNQSLLAGCATNSNTSAKFGYAAAKASARFASRIRRTLKSGEQISRNTTG